MPSTSRKPKSQRGTNGPEEIPTPLTDLSNNTESPQLLLPPAKEDPSPVVADPVEDTVNKLSATDQKLARTMNREISKLLGLSKRSRSYRV